MASVAFPILVSALCGMAWCARVSADEATPSRTFLEAHCFDCHDPDSKKGGLDLENLQFDLTDTRSFAAWVKVYDRLHNGEMPPRKKAQPAAEERETFASRLAGALTAAEQTRIASEGRAVWRRLNRYEYENTLRDLLHAPWLQVKDMLPEDGESQRFNKVGEALDVSHVQMARYLSAAESALRQAMLPQATRPPTTTTRYRTREERAFAGKTGIAGPLVRRTFPVLGSQADFDFITPRKPLTVGEADPQRREEEGMGLVVSTYEPTEIRFASFKAPVTGRYKLRFCTNTIWVGPGPLPKWWLPDFTNIFPGRNSEPITIYSDIEPRLLRRLGSFDAEPTPAVKEIEAWLLVGETIRPDAARLFRSRPPEHRNPLAQPDGMPGVSFRWMEVEGPIFDAWPTKGHQLLFGDLAVQPAADGKRSAEVVSADPASDAPRLLHGFLQQAYRRPVGAEDCALFLDVIQRARDSGQSFTESMLAGYIAVLCSPEFLYLQEQPGTLDDFALASRLSYFLWNSAPDETLHALAEKSQLHDPATLRTQTERLLNDPKSRRFVDAFLDYWLDLRRIAANDADATLYPDYQLDDLLQESSIAETQLFFAELLQRNLPARNLVSANFAMLNERLASLYTIPGVEIHGVDLRRVSLPPDSVRGGLMTQASVLKITANGTTTSPVVRGVWVMERLLGERPPPPPATVPAVEPDTRGATTIREQLAKHRTEESCAVCHRQIDPAGFALESFDVMGGFRGQYRAVGGGEPVSGVGRNGSTFTFHQGPPVDPSGELPDGRKFKDIRELKALLASDEPKLARNLLKQFLIYATGTTPRFADREQFASMLDHAKSEKYGVRSLIHEIVQSPMFQTK